MRQTVPPFFFHGNNLDRNVAGRGIQLEVVQHRPTKHVRQENIKRDGGRLKLLGERERDISTRGHDAFEAFFTREARSKNARA